MIENTERSERTNIEKNVLRRVHTIRAVRPLVSLSALSTAVALLALYGIGKEVWVARVVENAPHELSALPLFYFSAFTNTEFVVQALSLVVLIAVVYLVRETAQHLTRILVLARA
jgi:hypothetical protein